MKIAYVSPLNPEKSGISDYSEEILPYLGKYMEIDIFTKFRDVLNIKIKDNFKVYKYSEFASCYNKVKYDFIVYHIGNNFNLHHEIYELAIQYPGVVVLHDYAIHHFMAEYTLVKGDEKKYIQEMIYSHGYEGLITAEKFLNQQIPPIWEENSLDFPLNKRIINSSRAVITTSKYVEDKVKLISPVIPTKIIPLHAPEIYSFEKIELLKKKYRHKYKFNEDIVVLGSFGFATANKRIQAILEALSKLKIKHNNFIFVIVGEVSENLNIKSLISKYGLKDNILITGYVTLDEFKEYMIMSDICFNLRYPIQGESSASLIRMMGYGKAVFVSDIGTFSEFNDESVLKIPILDKESDYLIKKLVEVFENRKKIEKYAYNAQAYVKENCSIEKTSEEYFNFLNNLFLSNVSSLTLVTSRLYNNLSNDILELEWGIEEREFIFNIVQNIKQIQWD